VKGKQSPDGWIHRWAIAIEIVMEETGGWMYMNIERLSSGDAQDDY
jgi:hypothetical protein